MGYGDGMRVAFVEWLEGLTAGDAQWEALKTGVAEARAEILVTNELPFGPWIAEGASFSREVAEESVRAHEAGLAGLMELGMAAVISSRPVWRGERLVNEAFVVEGGVVRVLHRKQYFPSEAGWFERDWFVGDDSGFAVAEVLGVRVGVLLCTEAMFNERARAYGREGAELIAIPRASGRDIEPWKIAGAMASLVSGAYVVSSNRVGPAAGGRNFGGGGFGYGPQGKLLAMTSGECAVQVVEVEAAVCAAARAEYPCYVAELP